MLDKLNTLYNNLLQLETLIESSSNQQCISIKIRQMELEISELMGEQIKVLEKYPSTEMMFNREREKQLYSEH